MTYLFSRATRPILSQLARERTLCAFDFDGTLAPITTRPEVAEMRARTRKLLMQVAALYPCIVLSGRSRADLLRKLEGTGIRRVVGNHGAETGASTRGLHSVRAQVRQWKKVMEREIASLPGVWIEDKVLSLSVHYRQSPPAARARWHILEAVGGLRDVQIFGGKQIVNLIPLGARHKGDALASERDRLKCTSVLFVGDDENDETAFALSGNIVPVRVGRSTKSHARYYLRTQVEIDELLRGLVSLRQSA